MNIPLPSDVGAAKLIGLSTVAIVVAIVARVMYNVFLHPLADVPGPFWARASGIPSWYWATTGNRHIWLWQQFEIYGPRVRVTPNTVLFRSPGAYRDIYSTKANVQKSAFYESMQKDSKSISTITTRERKAHAHKRKLLNQCFTDRSLRTSEQFLISNVDRWNELLVPEKVPAGEWSEPMNFSKSADGLVFDIMGDLAFGKSFDSKEPGDTMFRPIQLAGRSYMQFLYALARSPLVHLVLWLKPLFLDSLMAAAAPEFMRKYDAFVNGCIQKRQDLYKRQKEKPEAEQRQDMFWFLCEAKADDGSPAYNADELFAEASLLIIAGSDTASIALGGLMFYLTRNPLAYKKLVDEIRTTFSSPEEIVHGAALSNCAYLRACIDEAMRIHPPAPSELSREVLHGGAMIEGHLYPAGTIVGHARWAQYHDNDFWGDSEVFRPERWIPDEAAGVTPEHVHVLRSNFQPFAQGPGNCPGKNIAMLEMSLAVARTLHRFDVKKPEKEGSLGEGVPTWAWGMRNKNVFQMSDAYIALHDGPMVQFRKRSA